MSNTNTHVLTAAMVAAYPNAQILYGIDGKVYNICKIDFRDNEVAISYKEYAYSGHWVDMKDCKLVLTSPDNITDAQALEVAKGYYPNTERVQTVWNGKELIEDYKKDFVDISTSCVIEFVDICRPLNIDFGYKNIPSLIAAGLAVEKEVGNE